MSGKEEHHGWWWTTGSEYRSAAYLGAQAAGARAAQDGRASIECPYRDHGGAEERRLLACWTWGWSRVALFGEPVDSAVAGPSAILPVPTTGTTAPPADSSTATPLALWGLPDGDGRFLVRVIDYEHYEFAEDLSGVGNMLLAAVHRSVQQLHPEADYRSVGRYCDFVDGEYANPLVARLPDGTVVAARRNVGYSLHPRRESRPPTIWELARWAGLPPPPPPSAPTGVR